MSEQVGSPEQSSTPISETSTESGLKPPYRASAWYETFFDLLRQRKMSRVDIEFIKHNIVSDQGDAYKFRAGLSFLGLIDDTAAPTEKLNGLYLTGDEFTKNLELVVRGAYAPLFNTIVIERAKRQNAVNFLIQEYGYSPNQAERAVQLFVYFCGKAAIPMASDLVEVPKPRHDLELGRMQKNASNESKQIKTEAKRESRATSDQGRLDESFATLEFDDFMFRVRKDIGALDFARAQVNSLLDYLERRLKNDKSILETP